MRLFLLILGLWIGLPVSAHPHAFIDMQTDFIVDKDNLVGFRMKWLFDEPASAEILYDIRRSKNDTNARQKIADEIMQNIINQHYFSYFYVNSGESMQYTRQPDNYSINIIERQLLFSFNFYLSQPQPIKNLQAQLFTYDPSYYVAMSYPHTETVTLPTHPQCQVKVNTPTVEDTIRNYAAGLDRSQRDEDLTLGVQFAQEVLLSCQ